MQNDAIFLIDPEEKCAILQAKSGLPAPASDDKKEIIFKNALLKKRLIEEETYLATKPTFPRIIFIAEDDGIGFDTQIVGKDKRSLGLLGMRERASLLGGSFQLRSKPGTGTRIRIEIPFSDGSKNE